MFLDKSSSSASDIFNGGFVASSLESDVNKFALLWNVLSRKCNRGKRKKRSTYHCFLTAADGPMYEDDSEPKMKVRRWAARPASEPVTFGCAARSERNLVKLKTQDRARSGRSPMLRKTRVVFGWSCIFRSCVWDVSTWNTQRYSEEIEQQKRSINVLQGTCERSHLSQQWGEINLYLYHLIALWISELYLECLYHIGCHNEKKSQQCP